MINLEYGNVYLAGAAVIFLSYALHCYRQAIRHREIVDPTDVGIWRPLSQMRLTPQGDAYRKRFYWAAILGALAMFLAFPAQD